MHRAGSISKKCDINFIIFPFIVFDKSHHLYQNSDMKAIVMELNRSEQSWCDSGCAVGGRARMAANKFSRIGEIYIYLARGISRNLFSHFRALTLTYEPTREAAVVHLRHGDGLNFLVGLCGQGTELPSVICSSAEARFPRASAARNVYRSIPVMLLNFNGLRWSGEGRWTSTGAWPFLIAVRDFYGYLNRVQIAIVSGFLSVIYGAL